MSWLSKLFGEGQPSPILFCPNCGNRLVYETIGTKFDYKTGRPLEFILKLRCQNFIEFPESYYHKCVYLQKASLSAEFPNEWLNVPLAVEENE